MLRASWLPRQVEGMLIMLLLTALTVRRVKPGFSACRGDQDSLDWEGECPSPWAPGEHPVRRAGLGTHPLQPWEPPSPAPVLSFVGGCWAPMRRDQGPEQTEPLGSAWWEQP